MKLAGDAVDDVHQLTPASRQVRSDPLPRRSSGRRDEPDGAAAGRARRRAAGDHLVSYARPIPPPRRPIAPGGANASRASRQHYEEVVTGDMLVEVDPARVGLDALARPARRRAARIVDLAVDLVEADRLLAGRGRGVEAEDRAATAEIRRQLGALDLAAAVELERDQPRERERPAVEDRRAGHDRIGAAAGRGLVGDVERTFELGLQREAVP